MIDLGILTVALFSSISLLYGGLAYYKLSITYGVLAFITAIKALFDVVQG